MTISQYYKNKLMTNSHIFVELHKTSPLSKMTIGHI